jgi:hypothetical protein
MRTFTQKKAESHTNTGFQLFSIFLNMFPALVDDGTDVVVREGIENGFSFPAALDQLALL